MVCKDECSQSLCFGLDYEECIIDSDTCQHKLTKKKIKDKCGVECLSNSDCISLEQCKSYKCISLIVSTSFSDFNIFCEKDATTLQKSESFKKFKNKYIQWTGKVNYIRENSDGSYNLDVEHCIGAFGTDIEVTMKSNQKNNLLKLREGDTVTYIAKLSEWSNFWGNIVGKEGEVIE